MLPLPTGREASAGVAASVYERHRPERTLLIWIDLSTPGVVMPLPVATCGAVSFVDAVRPCIRRTAMRSVQGTGSCRCDGGSL